MNYLIGIDLGTSATKTVLFDENGTVIASASKEYPMYTPLTDGLSSVLKTGVTQQSKQLLPL